MGSGTIKLNSAPFNFTWGFDELGNKINKALMLLNLQVGVSLVIVYNNSNLKS